MNRWNRFLSTRTMPGEGAEGGSCAPKGKEGKGKDRAKGGGVDFPVTIQEHDIDYGAERVHRC